MTETFKRAIRQLATAPEVAPRGEATKELTGAALRFDRDEDVWCNYPARRLSVAYVCTEFLWYLRADPGDTSIAKYAKVWRDLVELGPLQSNYGVYLFREGQFFRCVKELIRDPFSRRASIVILRPEHYHSGSADIPCTYALNFRIRRNRLEMSVHMRSNDVWFGLGNDAPIFRWTQCMVAAAVQVQTGMYLHSADSLHIYQRHWGAAEKLLEQTSVPVLHPPITDPIALVEAGIDGRLGEPTSDFHAWLLEQAHA